MEYHRPAFLFQWLPKEPLNWLKDYIQNYRKSWLILWYLLVFIHDVCPSGIISFIHHQVLPSDPDGKMSI